MSDKASPDILKLLKSVIELSMPDMRHYYRMTRKARVVASYASDGSYYADVQPLRNDESDDAKEPLISKVEIPVIWGGPKRGIVCPPTPGTLCDLSYYDGDPNYPRISNFRWQGNEAPVAELEEFVIQLEPGVEIRIDKNKQIVALTPSNWIVKVGGNANITADGNANITAKGNVDVTASSGHVAISGANEISLNAPTIRQSGNVVTGGQKGKGTVEENADRKQDGSLTITGDISIGGNLKVAGSSSVSGNSSAGSRSGGVCPHP